MMACSSSSLNCGACPLFAMLSTPPVTRDLDDVRAFLVVLTHRAHRFGRTIDDVVLDARAGNQMRPPTVGEIAVPAGARDDAACGEDA